MLVLNDVSDNLECHICLPSKKEERYVSFVFVCLNVVFICPECCFCLSGCRTCLFLNGVADCPTIWGVKSLLYLFKYTNNCKEKNSRRGSSCKNGLLLILSLVFEYPECHICCPVKWGKKCPYGIWMFKCRIYLYWKLYLSILNVIYVYSESCSWLRIEKVF